MNTFLVAAAILMPSMYFICSIYIICEKCRKDNYNKEKDTVEFVEIQFGDFSFLLGDIFYSKLPFVGSFSPL